MNLSKKSSQQEKRLSIADLKKKNLGNQEAIDKIKGGSMDGCHTEAVA